LFIVKDAAGTVSWWVFTTVDGTTVQSIKVVEGPEHGTLFLEGNATTFVLTPGRLYQRGHRNLDKVLNYSNISWR
jgi:dTDP-4-dehydrorhamnose 3,5-epimerase-like enzyme